MPVTISGSSGITMDGTLSATGITGLTSMTVSGNISASGTVSGSTLSATGALSAGNIVGTVAFYALNTPPTGWLKANGALVSRTTYASLFAAIGTTFGAGDGSTTFALPDLRGEFIRAWDDGRSVDTARAFGSAQGDQNKAHTHGVTDPGHTHSAPFYTGTSGSSTSWVNNIGSGTFQTANVNSATTGITINSNGGTEARPRNVALLACIKF